MKNDAKGAANNLLRQYALIRPSLDDLVAVVADLGFEIVEFAPNSKPMEVLKERLSLTDSIVSQDAFVYQNGDVRLLFLRDNLNGQEKLYAVAHELGHIALGHVNARPSVIEEHEANEFSHYVLHPQMVGRLRSMVIRHRRMTVGVFAAIVLVLLAVGYALGVSQRRHYKEGFYVTPSGTKYHRAACSIIEGRTNARLMTREEYESGTYAPCALCVPED